jgi:hypothetical protein
VIDKKKKKIKVVDFSHLPQGENQMVDALSIIVVMFKIDEGMEIQPIKIEI